MINNKSLKSVQVTILVLFVLFLMPIAGWATTYYVAKNGNDSYNGLQPTYQSGSIGPFKTIGKGIAVLTNGSSDRLYIRAGTYIERVTVSKNGENDSNRIIISGYEDELVTISGNNNTTPTKCSGGSLFNITGNWVTLQNITITESGDYGLSIAGDNCKVYGVEISYSWRTGLFFSGADTGIASNSIIHHNSYSYNNCSGQTGYCGTWGSAFTATGSSNITLENSTIYNNWGEGVSVYNNVSNSTIQDNIVYDNGSVNLYMDSTYNCTAQRNILYFSTTSSGCAAENLVLRREYAGSAFSDNTIINNFVKGGNWPFRAGLSQNNGSLVNTVITNNTIVNDRSGAEYLFTISGPAGVHSNSQVRNNIFYEEFSTQYSIAYARNTAGIAFSNNFWSRTQAGVDDDVEGVDDIYNTDPLLEKNGETLSPSWFGLQSSSSAIDAGITIDILKEDFFETPRPQGSQIDIGAHEYKEGYATLNPPENLRILTH